MRAIKHCVLLALVLPIMACTGGSGQDVQKNPDLTAPTGNTSLVLNGPPARTPDVQSFRVNLWQNVAATNRCGACHGTGGQSPDFARNDDINLAYDQANSVVDLNQPDQSRLVQKVAGGHNCWLASDQACADILTTWIRNWAGGSVGASNEVKLIAPPDEAPGATKSFPADSSDYAATIYPIVNKACSRCHSDTAATPQAPFFASADINTAYNAAKGKIDIDTPANSRFVVKIGNLKHNCWTNCTDDAATMLQAINAFANQIPVTQVDPSLVASRALKMVDGIVSSGGGRNDGSVIAMYQFKTGSGTTVYDTSGVAPALNLTMYGNVSWVGGWGINISDGGRVQGATAVSKKLDDLISATGEYSIEAWVAPANVTQKDARIISYSGGTDARNFALNQTLYDYAFAARSSTTDANGGPAISTPDADQILQATLQHVVVTFDPTHGRQIYVNGARVDVADTDAGSLADWDNTFAFVLGNEVSGDRPWSGVLKLVAIHNRALTPTQIKQNFDAGVGEKYLLLFGVSQLIDVPQAYIVFRVSQFDSYSYLFSQPYFISLDKSAQPGGIPLRGLRVGINGRVPNDGQAYENLDLSLGGTQYSSDTGQPLSPMGTLFGIGKGPASDQFFLTFDQIGSHQHAATAPVIPTQPAPVDGAPRPDIGIKTFDEINATMADVTGVPRSRADVAATYSTIRQQLPSVPDLQTFLSSQQMAITQLAIQYCSALVDDQTLRATMFPGFNFNASTSAAFDAAGRDAVLTPLLDKTLGINVATQPDRTATRSELDSLITALSNTPDDESRTQTIVKATCSAALGNAAMLIK